MTTTDTTTPTPGTDDPGTLRVAAARERLSGVVQAVGRRPVDIERRWWESALVFATFALFYAVVGYWLVVEKHVVGFESLDRLNRALMVWYNEPPKLSSVGFDYPPLAVLLLAPFAVVPALASSLVVVPVVTALFAGLTMVVLNTTMRRAQVALPVRVVALAAVGLNPLVVMHAATGARSFLWLMFVVAALGALFAWYVTADIRFVMIAGLAYSVATLTGYGSLLYFLVSLVMIAAILARLGADGTEIEGTGIGFAAPTVYAVALWTVINLVLIQDPLNWLTESSDTASSGGLGAWSLGEVAGATLDLVVHGAPIALVVLPALVLVGIARRNTFALWLGLMLAVAVLAPGAAVLLRLTDSPMLMGNALPILLIAVVGGLWLARSAGTGAMPVAALLSAGLLVSIPWTFAAMADFEHQGLERAFHDAVATGASQEGATTLDGSTVGYADEEAMADFIVAHVDAEDSVLTDNARTYAVMLFSGRPDLFFDRIDRSDGPWREAALAPTRDVDYLLLSIDPTDDLLSELYPAAAAGTDEVLTEVFATDRYRLVRVPEGYTRPDGESVAEATDGLEGPATDDGSTDRGGVDGIVGEGEGGDEGGTRVPPTDSTPRQLPDGGGRS